ncbi:hypothetical protein [Kineosporia succinea]|uniref:Uncharacterized protein n=1 Tax=Kineosporia succinea TaxID=84632 RepID=A0ABT9NYL3_9ACTN|nr:hypothetical protein [Kineosporia succinea]MDP9825516.1 hypothetical protein [Kineosporia succinea]
MGERRPVASLVLNVDALGCLVGAASVASAPSVYRLVDPSGRSRPLVTGALVASSVLLRSAAGRPTRRALGRSAAVNAVWVLAASVALTKQQTPQGRSLVAATAVLDAAMGVIQWRLRATT